MKDNVTRDGIFENVNLDRLAEAELKDISQLRGLKARYEAAYPQTRNGANGGRGGRRNETGALTFSKTLSEYDGISLRTAERYLKIADGVSATVERRIYASDRLAEFIARRRMELLALAAHDEKTQGSILDLIEAGKASTVAEAEERLKLVPPGPLKWEREGINAFRTLTKIEPRARDFALGQALDDGLMDRLLAERGYVRQGTAGAAIANENEMTRYISAAALAERPLPGLPTTKKGVHERAVSQNWRFVDAPGRGGMMRLYLIDDLPATAIAEHERRQQIARIQRRERERGKDAAATAVEAAARRRSNGHG